MTFGKVIRTIVRKNDAMKTRYLFPHWVKIAGLVLSLVFITLGLALLYFDFELPVVVPVNTETFLGLIGGEVNNATDEIAGTGLIVGLMMLAFSREKVEDEFIAQLRLESLQWAVYINYVLLVLTFLLVYGSFFLDILIYNLFTVLIIFIIRFNFLLYRYNHSPEVQPA